MLQLRPNCELCDKDLPPDARDAYICTYECTFCVDCVDSELQNVCPNCGGELVRRPLRPKTAHRPGVSLQHQPASTDRVFCKYSLENIREFSASLKDLKPYKR
jgi:hypothetical protein